MFATVPDQERISEVMNMWRECVLVGLAICALLLY